MRRGRDSGQRLYQAPYLDWGFHFSGRPQLHFTRKQLLRELTDAGFSIANFYVWGGYGAVVAKYDGAVNGGV